MDFSNQIVFIIAYTCTNLLALGMLWLCWKKSSIARLLFFLLFIWAAFANAITSVHNPKDYLNYTDYALLPFYRNIINGFFSQHITVIVFSIAICELVIGISMFLKGAIFKLGCIGGIIFFLAITPLGFGSGSPAPLIWAIGLFILFKKGIENYWWLSFKKKKEMNPAQ